MTYAFTQRRVCKSAHPSSHKPFGITLLRSLLNVIRWWHLGKHSFALALEAWSLTNKFDVCFQLFAILKPRLTYTPVLRQSQNKFSLCTQLLLYLSWRSHIRLRLGIIKASFASALDFSYICSHDDKIIFSGTAACTYLLQRYGAHAL